MRPHLAVCPSRHANGPPGSLSAESLFSSTPVLHALRVLLVLSVACAGGCASDESEEGAAAGSTSGSIHAEPLPEAGEPLGRFEMLDAERTGIDFVHAWDPPDDPRVDIFEDRAGGGVALGDYTGNGLPDVYLTGPEGGRLYRNLGGFRFEDVTVEAGLDSFWAAGATFVDINGNGLLDLYVCGYDTPNRLYINQGDGAFREEGAAWGLDYRGASVMAAFADYTGDGHLDLYLVANRPPTPVRMRPDLRPGPDGRPAVAPWQRAYYGVIMDAERPRFVVAGEHDRLYRNNGNGTFTDVTQEAGIEGYHPSLAAVWWDYTGNGLPDLYVATDFFSPDRLYRNNGDGTFTDVIGSFTGRTPWFSMGVDVADVNNNGLLDLFATDMAARRHEEALVQNVADRTDWFLTLPEPRQIMFNTLYVNSGTARFLEVAELAGLARTDWTWSVVFGDLDNDGWSDLFVANGMTGDYMNADVRAQAGPGAGSYAAGSGAPPRRERNLAFRNGGRLSFEEVGEAWGVAHEGISFGAALADLDGDGSLDLVVNHFGEPAGVYRNRLGGGHRVKLRLEGTRSNRWGIGALVHLETADGRIQTRYLTLCRGYKSQSEPLVHFGLGDRDRIARLRVRWPSGEVQSFEDLEADRLYRIREPVAASQPSDGRERFPAPRETLFEPLEMLSEIEHLAGGEDDFAHQPLLPWKISPMGPALAAADATGNGLADLFMGGAAGHPGRLLLQQSPGVFRAASTGLFAADAAHADGGALFFDATGDGRLDLYVVSSGYGLEPGHELLQDRLYLNRGGGRFVRADPDALPPLRDAGSVVVAGDFDRSGRLDLFIGTRVLPGRWPRSGPSRLLRNQGGRFVDATEELAPDLQEAGMVRGALWSDATGDGWLDLLVACEYGPVRFYRNAGGRLEERTEEAGLAGLRGWWSGIAGADLTGNGAVDYVVTNLGRNSRYRPGPSEPYEVYHGDLDGTGRERIVEAYRKGDRLLPLRGKDGVDRWMPAVGARFETYRAYATATLEDVYGAEVLEAAYRVDATEASSGVLFNDGGGRFEWRPLPLLAQSSPGHGLVLEDLTGDGAVDVYVTQNFHHPQPQTPRMDGGVGALLRGDGQGGFEAVWPDRSGLVVPGDGRSAILADVTGDGLEELVLGLHGAGLRVYRNRALAGGGVRPFRLHLRGPAGNPTAIGSRVRVELATSSGAPSIRTREVYAGGGYLSQSSGPLLFFSEASERIRQVEVDWPDGRTTRHELDGADLREWTVAHPDIEPEPRGAAPADP